jgi:hypothetical protein
MNKRILLFVSAFLLYGTFAAWLLFPHTDKLSGNLRIFYLTQTISALGVYFLSARYVNSFFARLIGGAVYGFGPFACSFFCYHPFGFAVYALLPWSFLPAVFVYKFLKTGPKTTGLIEAAFALLPFLFVIACFTLAAMPKYRLFPIPPAAAASVLSFIGIISPFKTSPDVFLVGFYHTPLGALAVGAVLLFQTRRYGIAAIAAVAVFFAFYKLKFNTDVPPAFWLSFPVLICSIMIASGFEMLTLAGKADSKWLLLSASAVVLQLAVAFLFARPVDTNISLAVAGASIVAFLLVFFIARAGLALHLLRRVILYSIVALDIIIVTRNLIDVIF